MLLNFNINEIDNVDVLRFICSELDASNGSLREELFETENSLFSYRDCLHEITGVLRSFNFDNPDLSFASDVCNTIYNILEEFYIHDV